MHAVHACILSHFSSVWLLVIPWTVAFQVRLSMGFSGQEYWSGLPSPSPGDLPDPEIEPRSLISLALAVVLYHWVTREVHNIYIHDWGSAGKESVCNEGDLGSIPGAGRSPREGKGYPHQYFGLENSMDCIVCGVAKSRHDWVAFIHLTITLYTQYHV